MQMGDNGRMPRAVLLDRDGVINHDSEHYIKSVSEWRPIEGSIEAIAAISRAGFPVAICTNQAGIARGKLGHSALGEIHAELLRRVSAANGHVHLIRYCPHHPNDNCRCRKPGTGMLEDAARYLGVDLESCWFVGDSAKDLQAARAAGCTAVLVRTGNGCHTETTASRLADLVFDKLSNASEWLDV